MDAPTELRDAAAEEDDIAITRRENDDGSNVVVVDFGPGIEASLDVVGGTAIVVAGDQQFEFEMPDDVSEVRVNDGMLLLED